MTNVTKDRLAAMHALLDQALDLAPAEREAWLARLRKEQSVDVAELEGLLGWPASGWVPAPSTGRSVKVEWVRCGWRDGVMAATKVPSRSSC